MTPSDEQRFWGRVDTSGGIDACWPWQGNLNDNGYGRVRIAGRSQYAHRVALSLALGRAVRSGMQACHTCDNPACANPTHVYEGTSADNHADMLARDRAPRALLPEPVVALIRSTPRPDHRLAASLGVSLRTIYRARRPEYRARKVAA